MRRSGWAPGGDVTSGHEAVGTLRSGALVENLGCCRGSAETLKKAGRAGNDALLVRRSGWAPGGDVTSGHEAVGTLRSGALAENLGCCRGSAETLKQVGRGGRPWALG